MNKLIKIRIVQIVTLLVLLTGCESTQPAPILANTSVRMLANSCESHQDILGYTISDHLEENKKCLILPDSSEPLVTSTWSDNGQILAFAVLDPKEVGKQTSGTSTTMPPGTHWYIVEVIGVEIQAQRFPTIDGHEVILSPSGDYVVANDYCMHHTCQKSLYDRTSQNQICQFTISAFGEFKDYSHCPPIIEFNEEVWDISAYYFNNMDCRAAGMARRVGLPVPDRCN